MAASVLEKDYRIRTIWGVALGYFMVQVALVPVNAMLPTLRHEMDIGVGASGWIMTTYLLSLTSFLLIAGRLGDQFSHQRIFKIGIVLFGISSLFAGLVTDYTQLIVCRAFQGLGAALFSGNSMAIVHKSSSEENRAKTIGYLTSAAALGSLLGIILGSMLIQFISWRWLFLICIPVTFVSFLLIKDEPRKEAKRNWKEIDIPGGILLYLFLVLVTFSFSTGPNDHAGHGGEVVLTESPSLIKWDLLLVAILCLILFVIVEKRAKQPMVYFGQFRNIPFTASVLANFILHFVMISVVFFVPFLVEEGLRLVPLYTALVYLSVEIMNAALPPLSNYLYHRKKYYWLRPVGMGIVAAGLTLYYFTVDQVGVAGYMMLGCLIGLGMGTYWSINNHVIMDQLEDKYRGFSSGMLETTRQMGHAMSSGIAAVVMSFSLDQHSSHGGHGQGMEALYSGTQTLLVIAVFMACAAFLLSFIKGRNETA